jgi:hypothetical protein
MARLTWWLFPEFCITSQPPSNVTVIPADDPY